MVKNNIMNLDLSKASGTYCIPVVVLKNCVPKLSSILAELSRKCLNEFCFPDCWKVSSVVPVIKNVGDGYRAKNYCHVSLLSVVSKVFEKLVNNRIVDHLKKCDLFFISRMVLGLLIQLLIFSQLLGFLTSLGLLQLWHLIYPRLLTESGMLVFFRNFSFMKFQVRYLALFLLFSVIDGLEWFWMETLHKNIQLVLEFLKASFLVLQFSYFTLMTFLTMLPVILLYILMKLLSILIVIRHLIYGTNLNWLLNLNLIYETLWTGVRSSLLISMLGKLNWFHLTSLITMVLLMWKWIGLFLRKNHLLRCLGWPALLNWIGALTLSLLLKLPSRKLELPFMLWSFFLLRLLFISINLPYAHVWNTAVKSGLVTLVTTCNC